MSARFHWHSDLALGKCGCKLREQIEHDQARNDSPGLSNLDFSCTHPRLCHIDQKQNDSIGSLHVNDFVDIDYQ